MKPEAKYIKALKKLTKSVIKFECRFDDIMNQPHTAKRDRDLAFLINWLTIENQSAMHFTLSYPFEKIEKMYKKEK